MNTSTPGTPPPLRPVKPAHNPYDFIIDPPKPPKKQPFSSNTKMQRMLVIGGAATLLLILIIGFFSILNRAGSAVRNDYRNALQQQTEIIRVSAIGIEKSRSSDAKNLALTTKLSMESSQTELISLAKSAGADTKAKTLALGKDTETDKALTAADQANKFDEVFVVKLTGLLNEYQQTLKRLYNQASKDTTKQTLQQAYDDAGLLMQNGKP